MLLRLGHRGLPILVHLLDAEPLGRVQNIIRVLGGRHRWRLVVGSEQTLPTQLANNVDIRLASTTIIQLSEGELAILSVTVRVLRLSYRHY